VVVVARVLVTTAGHDRINDVYGVCAMLEHYLVHRRVLLRKLVISIAAEWIAGGHS
jgi:hypothetical protein